MNDDPLAAAKGCMVGVVLGGVLWALILFGIASLAGGYVLHPFAGGDPP